MKLESSDPNIWEKNDAKNIFQNIKSIENKISDFNKLSKLLHENEEIYKFIQKDNDKSLLNDLKNEVELTLKLSEKIRYLNLLNDEADHLNAFIEIHAGAGGTESQDWAEILQRMYLRWAENQDNCKVSLLQEMRGEEAGVKSCTLKIVMDYSYGWLKKESGIHRLVRISPFDSNKRRHTSFASVWVYPEIDDKIDIEIKESDLRIDTYRASGAGGQHVNKTDSAVRITHIPSGIVVQNQDEKSQNKNKQKAMKVLRAKILKIEQDKMFENMSQTRKSLVGGGDRSEKIRTYNFPQGRVSDHRINLTLHKIDDILDGNLDELNNNLSKNYNEEESKVN